MTGYEQSPDDLIKRAREIGQFESAGIWQPAANENERIRPTWQGDLFLALLAFVLIGAALLAFFG